MKRHIRSCILFLVLLFVLLVLLSWVFLPKNNSIESGMQRLEGYSSGYLAEPDNTLDFLFLGDSMTANAIVVPELWENYGLPGYTIGGPNQSLTKAMYYLNRFTQHQSPKVVLVEAYELYQPIDTDMVIEDLAEPLLPVLKYHDNWKRPATLGDLSVPNYTVWNPYRGFYTQFAQVSCASVAYMAADKALTPVAQINKDFLLGIRQRCEKIGAQLILFSIPSQNSWDWGKHLGAQAVAQELDIPYLDLNLCPQQVPICWETDSTDGGIHLNYLGGTKVTAYLGQYLTESGILQDRRQDPGYQNWESGVQELHQWISENVPSGSEEEVEAAS